MKKVVTYLFVFCCMFLMLGMSTQAASKNAKIYKKFLKKGSTTVTINIYGEKYKRKVKLNYFTLIDIDKNGVKELVVNESKTKYATSLYIFTIRGGKVRFLGEISTKDCSLYYNAKYKGLVCYYSGLGAQGYELFKIKKNKLKSVVYLYQNISTYEVNNKKCSKKKYSKYVTKYFAQSTANIKTYKVTTANTKANRNKLLK